MNEEGQEATEGTESEENVTTLSNDAAEAKGAPDSPFSNDPATRKKQQVQAQAKPAAAVPSEKKKYQVKVDGLEKELELDEAALKAYIQKGLAADKRLEEIAYSRRELQKQQKELEDFYEKMEKDPRGTLKKHPRLSKLDLRSISEQELMEHLERESMDPRDLKIQELEAREQEREAKIKAEQEEKEKAEREQYMQKVTTERKNAIAQTIGKILNSPDSNLPHDPRVVGRIAQYMQHCIRNEIPFTQESIVEKVNEDFRQDFTSFFSKASPKQMYEMIGPDRVKDLMKFHVELASGPKSAPKPQAVQPIRPGLKKKYKTIDEKNEEEFGSRYVFPEDY